MRGPAQFRCGRGGFEGAGADKSLGMRESKTGMTAERLKEQGRRLLGKVFGCGW
jgi:hypothetical protein